MSRRQPKPSPARDFRALAELPPQRPLTLPTAVDEPPAEEIPDEVELRVRRDADGRLYALLMAAARITDSSSLRRLAQRLHDAADALDGGAS